MLISFLVLLIFVQASDATVSWRGLELAVMYVFKGSLKLNLPFFSLTGAADPNADRMLGIWQVRVLETPAAAGQYPPIAQGDCVICWRGAAVIDMFVWATDGNKYFIQVSQSAYRAHPTKLPNLFTTPIKNAAGYDTVYDFYSKCTDPAFQVGQAPIALQANEHYVYITTSKTKTKGPLSAEEKRVCCIAAPQLHLILGQTIADMFK